jgi:dTDP-4-dehydrorhamnose reductase
MKPKEYSILRTSWLYGLHNSKSFVHKFIKNALECTKANKPIEVTSDEFSVPTNTGTLVDQINIVLNNNVYGVRHVVDDWEHPVSRLEFAKNIAATYNDIIKDNHLNQPQINEELIVGVERPDKLQPTVSCMYSTCCTSWENKLYMFLKKYLIELES